MIDMTILVASCDSYDDTWYPFFKLFHKHWKDCKYKIVLNTETKNYKFGNLDIRTYPVGNGVEYGTRMLHNLDKIDSEFTLMLMSDFFIKDDVDEELITECAIHMRGDKNIAVFSFNDVKDNQNIDSEKYPLFQLRPQVGQYKLNFQAAIWRTSDLKSYWKKHEDPWQWELKANMRTFNSNKKFYIIKDVADSPIKYGQYDSIFGIFRGQWVKKDVVKLFKNNDIIVDYALRGFYDLSKKYSMPKLGNNSMISNKINFIRSVGFIYFAKSFIWRCKRKGLRLLGYKGKNYSYYEHLRATMKQPKGKV
ncbi:MAG: hypothetical protein R3Y45_06865 [Bacillota bacterium]